MELYLLYNLNNLDANVLAQIELLSRKTNGINFTCLFSEIESDALKYFRKNK